jgi:hypothetical protein
VAGVCYLALVLVVMPPLGACGLGYLLIVSSFSLHGRLRDAAADAILARSAHAGAHRHGDDNPADSSSTATTAIAKTTWEAPHPGVAHETVFRWDPRVVRFCIDEGTESDPLRALSSSSSSSSFTAQSSSGGGQPNGGDGTTVVVGGSGSGGNGSSSNATAAATLSEIRRTQVQLAEMLGTALPKRTQLSERTAQQTNN